MQSVGGCWLCFAVNGQEVIRDFSGLTMCCSNRCTWDIYLSDASICNRDKNILTVLMQYKRTVHAVRQNG